MKCKRKIVLAYLVCCFILALIFNVNRLENVYTLSPDVVTTDTDARFYLNTSEKIGVSYVEHDITVQFEILSGTLLGNGTVSRELWGGYLSYLPEADANILCFAPQDRGVIFHVADNYGENNLTTGAISGTAIIIYWTIAEPIWFPLHLGLGMLGLIFLCIVPVLGIKKLKQKDYVWTMVYVPIGILVGIALVIAWLWV